MKRKITMKKKNLSLFLSAAALTACILAGNSMNAQAAENVAINSKNFPNENFRSFVRQYDQSENGILEASELAAVETMNVEVYTDDLTGIEHFVNLKELDCSGNYLMTLDVSSLNNLTVLNCGGNSLSSLKFGKNLTELYCGTNYLRSLDLRDMNRLTKLGCGFNNLPNLDVSNFKNLTYLDCENIGINSLNLLNLNNLTELYCGNNYLRSLDVSNLKNLKHLTCEYNEISTLDTSNLTKLESLNCSWNNLSKLNVSNSQNLTELDCSWNNLSELNVSNSKNLTELNCYENKLSHLDVSNLTKLTSLNCGVNDLNTLYVNGAVNLDILDCGSNNLSSLDVSSLKNLTSLDCCENKISSLNLRNLTKLVLLVCFSNNLDYLDVSNSKELAYFDCRKNKISYLDLHNLDLEFVLCSENKLSCLDLSGSSSIANMKCDNNVCTVSVSSKNQFDLSTLKGFDVKKCSNWSGGTVSGTILTFKSDTVTYTYDTGLDGNPSPLVKFTLKKSSKLATPSAAKLSNTASGIKVSWSSVSGAEKYRVYRKTASTGWSKIADTTSTSYVDKTAKSGTSYTYTIRCINAAATAFTSDYNKTGSTLVRLAQPTVKAANASTGVKLSWSAVSGADSYILYYKTTGSWIRVAADPVKGTSYTWKGAKSGTSYKFTMKAVKGSTQSSYNTTGTALTYVAQPTVKAANASTGVKLSWSAVSGADSYILYYKTTGGWTRVVADPVKGTSYTWKGAKSGTSYKFTMKAVKGSTQSSYNTTGTALVRLTQPTLGTLSRSGKNLTLTWSKVTGASAYRVYRKTGTGSWVRIATVTGTSYTDVYNDTSKLTKGTTYTYTVRAEKGSSLSSYNTTGKKITY